MTDEKIKKALECCASETGCMCSQCPLNKDEDCLDNLPKYALAFIDQQQAEIERLKYLLKCEETKYDRCAKQLYKAGVKEFAKLLRETDGYNNHIFDDCASILVSEEYRKGRDEKIKEIWNTIDCLKKEMVGGEDV